MDGQGGGIARRLLGTTMAASLAVLGVAFLVEHLRDRADIEEAAYAQAEGLARTVAALLPVTTHEELARGAPADTPEHLRALRSQLASVAAANGTAGTLRTLRVAERWRAQLPEDPQRAHPAALEVVLDASDPTAAGTPVDYVPELAPALLQGVPTRLPSSAAGIQVVWPLAGAGPSAPGVVVVTRSNADSRLAVQESLREGLLLLLALSLCSVLAMSLVARRVVNPIVQLTRAAEAFAGGRADVSLVVDSPDETGRLSRVLEQARTERAQKERALEAARTRAEAARDDAEAARREAVAARDEAEKANRAKSQFLANMSHELRTPLNAIIGYSEILHDESEDMTPAEVKADLQKIQGSGKHLLGLINDILDLSKIEAGRMDLYLETFPLRPLLADVEATVAPLVEKNGNRLVVEAPPDLGSVHADATKLRQVLLNLLSNAAKFTEKGTLTLRAHRVEDGGFGTGHMELAVSDTGLGMTQEQLGRLFQAFSQADASTTRKYGGTGLGLAISRHFCRMMGGDIRADARPGAGSTFTVTLPTQVRSRTGIYSPAVSVPPTAAGRGPLVLVIDDDPGVHDLVARYLRQEGFRTAFAPTGRQGLELARQDKPDVITLDVMMPGEDGWSVLGALKADAALAQIPVIMMTMVDDRSLGFAMGAADYMTKPVDRSRLVGVLRRLARLSAEVLLVEDDPATRDVMRKMLEKEGAHVREAANGREALVELQKARPDIIFLDLMMPEMDGFQFVQHLQQQPGGAHIPVVVVTAKDLTAEDRARLNGHVEQVLQKGAYERETLLRRVRELVGGSVVGAPAGQGEGQAGH